MTEVREPVMGGQTGSRAGDAVQALRRIVLFGRNVASYKFALSLSLLELSRSGRQFVRMDELAEPFSKSICEHLRQCDRQGTFQSSRFLDACRYFNEGKITATELTSATVLLGFQNVIDAFHVVDGGLGDLRLFIDRRKEQIPGIELTDDLLALAASAADLANLDGESEARWRLVERAWEANARSEQLRVLYDAPRELLVPALLGERRPITEVRPALNGYQRGRCFYCFRPIRIDAAGADGVDVDHVFPFSLMARGLPIDLDHVWNLVLSCRTCNRGSGGKFAELPDECYDQRLSKRNEWLIESHHPLRETLIAWTGATPAARVGFLQQVRSRCREIVRHRGGWRSPVEGPPVF